MLLARVDTKYETTPWWTQLRAKRNAYLVTAMHTSSAGSQPIFHNTNRFSPMVKASRKQATWPEVATSLI